MDFFVNKFIGKMIEKIITKSNEILFLYIKERWVIKRREGQGKEDEEEEYEEGKKK